MQKPARKQRRYASILSVWPLLTRGLLHLVVRGRPTRCGLLAAFASSSGGEYHLNFFYKPFARHSPPPDPNSEIVRLNPKSKIQNRQRVFATKRDCWEHG